MFKFATAISYKRLILVQLSFHKKKKVLEWILLETFAVSKSSKIASYFHNWKKH